MTLRQLAALLEAENPKKAKRADQGSLVDLLMFAKMPVAS